MSVVNKILVGPLTSSYYTESSISIMLNRLFRSLILFSILYQLVDGFLISKTDGSLRYSLFGDSKKHSFSKFKSSVLFLDESNNNNVVPKSQYEVIISNKTKIKSSIQSLFTFMITTRLANAAKPQFRWLLYGVEMTNPPSLVPRSPTGESSLIERLSKCSIVTLGYHSMTNEQKDNSLAVRIVCALFFSSEILFRLHLFLKY